MAAKATHENTSACRLAISTNDGLGLNRANMAKLMMLKIFILFLFGQEHPDQETEIISG